MSDGRGRVIAGRIGEVGAEVVGIGGSDSSILDDGSTGRSGSSFTGDTGSAICPAIDVNGGGGRGPVGGGVSGRSRLYLHDALFPLLFLTDPVPEIRRIAFVSDGDPHGPGERSRSGSYEGVSGDLGGRA